MGRVVGRAEVTMWTWLAYQVCATEWSVRALKATEGSDYEDYARRIAGIYLDRASRLVGTF